MGKYIVKRVLLAIVSILIVSAITFFVMNIIPGGPFNKEKATSAEAQKVLEERYNLDKPIPEQYVIYMNNLLVRHQLPLVICDAKFLKRLYDMHAVRSERQIQIAAHRRFLTVHGFSFQLL